MTHENLEEKSSPMLFVTRAKGNGKHENLTQKEIIDIINESDPEQGITPLNGEESSYASGGQTCLIGEEDGCGYISGEDMPYSLLKILTTDYKLNLMGKD